MKEKIAKLIDVKSIMTIMLTLVFCILALCGVISGSEFMTIFAIVVSFYFGTQAMKKAEPVQPVTETVYTRDEVAPTTTESNEDVVISGFQG